MNRNVDAPIGVFDSGLGGLTVVRQLHRVLPHEDLVYLGDTARVPYGTKSPGTVIRFAFEDTRFLLQQQVKAVVVACNTASAWALAKLQRNFSIPVLGVILPGVEVTLKKSRLHRIGVIGTNATIRSQAYTRAIRERDNRAKVYARACPLLVPLVEEGWTRHDVTYTILHEYLDPLLNKQIDALTLGCTHYPLIKPAIRIVAGKGIALIDSAECCAHYVKEHLAKQNLLQSRRRRAGVIQPYVTDEPDRFDELAPRFLRTAAEPAWQVDLASVGGV